MKAGHWLHGEQLLPDVVVVSLGGNLGGVEAVRARMSDAIDGLSAHWGTPCVSNFYLSQAIGPVADQPDFVNAVAAWRP